MSTSTDNTHAKTFKTFPEFSKLTLADKDSYEKFIKDYLPIADLSFPMLMTWWNCLDSCAVSILNDNLVVSYWLPGAEKQSGLSILGTKNIDESICTIFDHLRENEAPVQLVHVPEFVIESIQYPELFMPKEERGFDEYIFPISKFYPAENMSIFRRKHVLKTISSFQEKKVEMKTLDLSVKNNQKLLLDKAAKWKKTGTIRHNNIAKNEEEAMRAGVINASLLGIDNLCLFIDGELYGFSLHELYPNNGYAIALNVRISPDVPYAFDFMLFKFAEWLNKQRIDYINMKYDLGILGLRMFKLTLGPITYFRKYTIMPLTK